MERTATVDEELVRDLKGELARAQKLDAAAIAVSAREGRVTLRGTVGSPLEQHEAQTTAERMRGVVSVSNELQVRPLDEQGREDADLRGAVLQALMQDDAVPQTVDVTVEDGVVTLAGTARSQHERETAELAAGNVAGVRTVRNEIEPGHPATPDAGELKEAIRHAFRRAADLDADGLTVSSSKGTVTIEGTVRSWAEHDDALAAARAASGVVSVRDRIVVEYP